MLLIVYSDSSNNII